MVREKYISLQDGRCYYCKADLESDPPEDVLSKRIHKFLFPADFFKHPIHLHHNHDTGLTIGAVHAFCNAVLWQFHGE